MNRNLKNIFSLFIIISIIIMPFSSIKKVQAETVVNYGATNTSSDNTSLTGIVNNLSPLIKKLPGCSAILGGGGVKDLFSKSSTKNNQTGGGRSFNENTSNTDTLTNQAMQKASEETSIPVFSQTADDYLKKQLDKQGKILSENTDINKSTATDSKNNNCLNAIGKAVIKMLIDRITVSIVNWIQTGNSGDPFFVTNPSDYFKDLGKTQILSFGQEISDPTMFPFGKSFMSGVANSFNQKFQDNARYSLDKVSGGWDVFGAAAQNPANNPFGFALMASNELSSRIASEATQKTNEMTQSGGFLGDEKCTDPWGVTREENDMALKGEAGTSVDSSSAYIVNGYNIARKCKRWEIVTPGLTISHELTKKMDNSDNALLSADTLNDAIAAILDAFTAKLSSGLTDQNNGGLMGINGNDLTTSYDTGNYDSGLSDYSESQVGQDFSSYQRDSSPWLQGHPDFNILIDVNQALIDEQRIYIDKLKNQNYTLQHQVPGTKNYEGLIPTIYQLDYCIPGPHPGWEQDARAQLSLIEEDTSKIISTISDMTDSDFFSLLDSASMGALSTVVNSVNSETMDCGSTKGKGTASVIHQVLNNLTGLDFFNTVVSMQNANGGNNQNMCSVDGLDIIMQKIMFIYSNIINRRFNKNNLPSSAPEAENKFKEIPGYNQILKDNEGAIAFQEGVIKRLQTLKTNLENLTVGQSDYEEKLTAYKNSFALISTGLVSGGDIAHVADITNQAETERLYVLKTLIQGPVGCEQELANHQVAQSWPYQLWTHSRPIYPYPILYTKNATTGYDYTRQLDGIKIAEPVAAPKFGESSQPVGFSNAFLGDVIFTSTDGQISAQNVESNHNPGETANLWFTDIININSGINTENTTTPDGIASALSMGILNFSTSAANTPSTIVLKSPYIGGNAAFLEQYLKIY